MTLPTPRGRQTDVVHLAGNCHNVVLGTAGTGKSSMAMFRGLHLARPSTANHGPVLIVTYNNTLVTYLRHLAPQARQDLTIETYGKFARGYLASVGLMGYGSIATPGDVTTLVGRAARDVAATPDAHPVLSRELDWMIDELHWISGMGIQTEQAYQQAGRIGRLTPLPSGPARTAIWAVRQRYRTLRTDVRLSYDWYDIAGAVSDALAVDPRPRLYRHIVIDEGQDLSPQALRSLTAAVQPGGSLTFFGDYHQAIYGQGLSWRASGIVLGNRRVEKFVDNYRNTTQIANLAIAMVNSQAMAGTQDDLVVPQAPVAAGPLPTLIHASSADAEVKYLRDFVADAGRDQSVAVLARTWADARRVVAGLPSVSLSPDMRTWTGAPGVYVGAYHSAKGLEFDAVVMPFLDDAKVPHPDVLSAYDEEEACSREARLLYVSLTRARVTLVMSHSGLLTRLLPARDGSPDGAPLWVEESV